MSKQKNICLGLIGLTLFGGMACDSGHKEGQDVAYYSACLADTTSKHHVACVSELLKIKDGASATVLATQLSAPDLVETRKDIVKHLRDHADASVVPALIKAIDNKTYPSTDKKGVAINIANERIAKALGQLAKEKDAAVVDALLGLADSNHLPTQLAAIESLGKLKSEKAVDMLVELADGHTNNFIVKNAVISLGQIGSDKAIPVLIKMMFFERKGASFYIDASYALFQIGPKAIDPLIKLYNGQWKPIESMHVEAGVQKAKSIQVLQDLGRHDDTISACMKSAKNEGELTSQALAITFAQRCLGWYGVKEAAPVLKKYWDDTDQSRAEHALEAIARIGATELSNDLMRISTHDGFVKQCVAVEGKGKEKVCGKYAPKVRQPRVKALSQIAPGSMLESYRKMLEGVENKKLKEELEHGVSRLEAAGQCKADDIACWSKLLDGKNAQKRERAALQLAWLQNADADKALIKAVGDEDNEVRTVAALALYRSLPKEALAEVEKTYKRDKGKTQYVRTNEDLKRLLLRLRRGA